MNFLNHNFVPEFVSFQQHRLKLEGGRGRLRERVREKERKCVSVRSWECIYVCVHVLERTCVCVRERDRERENERGGGWKINQM